MMWDAKNKMIDIVRTCNEKFFEQEDEDIANELRDMYKQLTNKETKF